MFLIYEQSILFILFVSLLKNKELQRGEVGYMAFVVEEGSLFKFKF